MVCGIASRYYIRKMMMWTSLAGCGLSLLLVVLLMLCDINTTATTTNVSWCDRQCSEASAVIVDENARQEYMKRASCRFKIDDESLISGRDMLNGPINPLGIGTGDTIDCTFIEPNVTQLIGGATPKFNCEYEVVHTGEKVRLRIKYDQQYNSVNEWFMHGNDEVYASVVSQRVLWALGFGSDQSVPVTVNCIGCPEEPW